MPFLLDSNFHTIVTTAELDREQKSDHQFTILATDRAVPYHSSSAKVTVHILDQNDNNPVFTQSQYLVNVLEKSPIGSAVFHLVALDADSGRNGDVMFGMEDGPTAEWFTVEEHSGLVRLAKAVDRYFCVHIVE